MAGRRILAALSASSGVGCRWATRKGICRVLRSSVARVVTTNSRAGKHNGRDGGMGMRLEDKGTRIEGTESRDAGLEIQLGSRKDRGRRGRTGDAKKMWD